MNFRKATRKQAKIKLAIQGPSGAGKTYSALLLAKGLVSDWSKVVIIDTENNSADLYAHLGDYNVLPLSPPHSPERYSKAIDLCLQNDIQVIILDSISHCWDYLLDTHAQMTGNSFTNWSKITPRHKSFIQKILAVDKHIIATMRTKQDYVINQKNGKNIPEKIGLKAIQRDGVDYEFTILLELNSTHQATATKDRTNLFHSSSNFTISESTGEQISSWCTQGISASAIKSKVGDCQTLDELKSLYKAYPEWYKELEPLFSKQKQLIIQSTNPKSKSNGTTTSKS